MQKKINAACVMEMERTAEHIKESIEKMVMDIKK